LRYGFFYGHGTWYRPDGAIAEQVRNRESTIIGDGNAVWSFVHIDDAVAATVASVTAEPEIYNVVDDDPLPVSVAAGLRPVGRCTGTVTRERGRDAEDRGRGSGLPPCEADGCLQQPGKQSWVCTATVALENAAQLAQSRKRLM